jgi:HK97 family phage major capsid protein
VDRIAELDQEIGALRARQAELDVEYKGQAFPPEAAREFDQADVDIEERQKLKREFEHRNARLAANADNDDATERSGSFQTRRPGVATGDDIFDLASVRSSAADPQGMAREMRDRSMRWAETAQFPHVEQIRHQRRGSGTPVPNREDVQAHIEHVIRNTQELVPGDVARYILSTGSPLYRRAFWKTVAHQPLNADEQRALALGAGATGGFSVIPTLDPTLVPTSNFSINPFRAISRVETIAGTNEWRALTSGAITAAYAAEATQASDNAPTLAQPDLTVDKAQAFVPFSIELGEDWGALEAEMGGLLSDAKDDLEATKFAVGAGHGSNEPKGLITAATATTTAGGSGAFAIADLYKVFEALPPRFRPRAQWVGNLFTFDKVRQFDTAGGSGVWVDNDGVGAVRGLGPGVGGEGLGGNPVMIAPKLLGRNAWEATAMASVLTTGSKILAIGDFRYFVIIDRIGMNIELIQNLVGANQRPTGQRGLYAYWRNQSDVLSTTAFQVLVTG